MRREGPCSWSQKHGETLIRVLQQTALELPIQARLGVSIDLFTLTALGPLHELLGSRVGLDGAANPVALPSAIESVPFGNSFYQKHRENRRPPLETVCSCSPIRFSNIACLRTIGMRMIGVIISLKESSKPFPDAQYRDGQLERSAQFKQRDQLDQLRP